MLIAAIGFTAMIGMILFMQGTYRNQELDDREQEEFLKEWKERRKRKSKNE